MAEDISEEKVAEAAAENSEVQGDESSVADDVGISKDKSRNKNDGTVAYLGDRIEIFCDQFLPDYSVKDNKAFRACSKSNVDEQLFAIVCELKYVPRRRAASDYPSFSSPCLLPFVTRGKIFWPPAQQERYVFIYKDTLGKRVFGKGDGLFKAWKPEMVTDAFVKPMVEMLLGFSERGFFHGGIRADNLFGTVSGDAIEDVMFGDCLSMPASAGQSALFEPIERAMADPVARGNGRPNDDLYSFGVLLIVLMRSYDPLEGMSDDEIIREKIANGSYNALVGKDRFKGDLLELARGILIDNPEHRWDMEDVMAWLDGRRLTPKQAAKNKAASRPFVFCGEEIFHAKALAAVLDKSPTEVAKIVDDEVLDQWLGRALVDDGAMERLFAAKEMARDTIRSSQTYPYLITAFTAHALDQDGPLRFRGLRLMGHGIGSSLHEAMVLKKDLVGFADMFLQSVAIHWANMTQESYVDFSALASKFEACRGHIRQTKVGYGIEKCLYFLEPDTPCLSPIFENRYIASIEDMMLAFEELCVSGHPPRMFLDRHVIAYIHAQDSKVIDSYLYDLNSKDEHEVALANLGCLAGIQKRFKVGKVPGIARYFLNKSSLLLKKFHDRELRDDVKSSMEKYVKSGNLGKIHALLTSSDTINKDFRMFLMAKKEYAALRAEYKRLDEQFDNEKTMGVATGRAIAAAVSAVLAIIVILISTITFYS